MLAPLTNCQSHPDGTLSDEEHHWLTMRADGGFGTVVTCAASVSATGVGFPANSGSTTTPTCPDSNGSRPICALRVRSPSRNSSTPASGHRST
ncbi:MAG: hypothetical protein R2705_25035 [Ilumatobacteraceae bacterium]